MKFDLFRPRNADKLEQRSVDNDYVSNPPPAIWFRQIIEKMNGQGAGAETIPFSVAVKAQGNIEDWLCDLLFKMQVARAFIADSHRR